MDAFFAEHGLALLAVILCLVGTLAIAPAMALVLSGSEYRDDLGITMPLALAMALLVIVGPWWIVGSPGDWSGVLRALIAGGALYVAFVSVHVELDDVHWRLGQAEQRIWDPVVPLGAAAVAVSAWLAIGAWLPFAGALVVSVAVLLAAAWPWVNHSRVGRRLTRQPGLVRIILSSASRTYAAWCDLDDALPPGWTVGEPWSDGDGWRLYAFDASRGDPRAPAGDGRPVRDWTAAASSEDGVIREMASALRAVGQGRVPDPPDDPDRPPSPA